VVFMQVEVEQQLMLQDQQVQEELAVVEQV
jgi:hypothetical protein